jgi:membrane protease YdiL (CAAX protease family)
MRRPYAWEGTLIDFVLLLFLFGLNLVGGIIESILPESLPLAPLLIIGELLVLGTVMIWVAVRRLPWQETFYLYRTNWLTIGLSVLVAICWWPVTAGLVTLIEQFFSLIGPPPELPPPENTFEAVGYFIAIVILAPLCEEPVFRGFITRGWLRYGFAAGVGASGILFGLQHVQLNAVVPISLLGTVIAIIALRSGSLWPAVAMHATHNSLSILFLLFPDYLDISDTTFIIAGVLAIPIALYALWRYHKMMPPFQPPNRESLKIEQGLAIVLSSLMVLGMFTVMILLEIFIRLNPDLGRM